MRVDKEYCMSSFLTFRYIFDENVTFKENISRSKYQIADTKYLCETADDIDAAIRDYFKDKIDSRTGIMLSGGMDSATLATYMPKGTKAYTLKSMAEGALDESEQAKEYAEICGLDHRIVEIYWEDYEKYSPILMKRKGAPIHSIEPMIYKAALQAKADGCDKLVFGDSADMVFGGLDGLLAKDWSYEEFVQRFTYLNPRLVLKNPVRIDEPFMPFWDGETFDSHRFVNERFGVESVNSYLNALACAGVEYVEPYGTMNMSAPINLERIRSGDTKYLVRELFTKRYNGLKPREKIPMPRAVGIWLADWEGPTREEFLPDCIEGLKADQKWLLYSLEMFLNMIDIQQLP